jgi:hypothetical protein
MGEVSFLGGGGGWIVHEQDDLGVAVECCESVRRIPGVSEALTRNQLLLAADLADQDAAADDRDCLLDPVGVGL